MTNCKLTQAVTVLSLIFGLNTPAFSAGGGGEIIEADPTRHYDPKGKLDEKELIDSLARFFTTGFMESTD